MEYTIKRLKELSEEIKNVKDGETKTADFYKGYLSNIFSNIKFLITEQHLVLSDRVVQSDEIDSIKKLIIDYDFTTQYIENTKQRHDAEKKNNILKVKLRELGVLEFKNIKL